MNSLSESPPVEIDDIARVFHVVLLAYVVLQKLRPRSSNRSSFVAIPLDRLCSIAQTFLPNLNGLVSENTILQLVTIFSDRLDICDETLEKNETMEVYEEMAQGQKLCLRIFATEKLKEANNSRLTKRQLMSLEEEFKEALKQYQYTHENKHVLRLSIVPPAIPALLNRQEPYQCLYGYNIADSCLRQNGKELNAQKLLESLRIQPWYKSQIVSIHNADSDPGEKCTLSCLLHPLLMKLLEVYFGSDPCSNQHLFSHQATAIEAAVRDSRDIILCTSTSSGKTLIFVSCILNSLLMNHNETAIILYPTKALAQDQLRAITQFIQPLPPSTCCSKCQRSDSPEKCPLVTAMIIDGDTIWERRKVVCEGANLILTNPDILHYTLLPESQRFARILSNLRYIVLDEAHVYRGVFGSHIAWVIRRLLWLCSAKYKTVPQVIYSSATIANPLTHYNWLTGRSISDATQHSDQRSRSEECETRQTTSFGPCLVSVSTAPSGERCLVMWNPPVIVREEDEARKVKEKRGSHRFISIGEQLLSEASSDRPKTQRSYGAPSRLRKRQRLSESKDCFAPSTSSDSLLLDRGVLEFQKNDAEEQRTVDGNQRRSSFIELAVLLSFLVANNVRTLAFCRCRSIVELVLLHSRTLLKSWRKESLVGKIISYRAGYSAPDRRDLEQRIFNGQVLGVVATNALELGVDIGTLDAVIILGYPGSISAMKQQFGRAGRGARKSICFFVAFNSPLDQYFISHGASILSADPEIACINVYNERILSQHLPCIAYENGPITLQEFLNLCHLVPTHHMTEELESEKNERIKDLLAVLRMLEVSGMLQRIEASPTPSWKFGVAPVEGNCLKIYYSSPDESEVLSSSTIRAEESKYKQSIKHQNDISVFSSSEAQAQTQEAAICRWNELATESRWAKAPCGHAKSRRSANTVELRKKPHPYISLRSIDERKVRVVLKPSANVSLSSVDVNGKDSQAVKFKRGFFSSLDEQQTTRIQILDDLDFNVAFFTVFPGAIYLNRGEEYLVEHLDVHKLVAYVVPISKSKYYTRCRDRKDVTILSVMESNHFGSSNPKEESFSISTGQVRVITQILGFHKISKQTHCRIETVTGVAIPPVSMVTEGLWIHIGPEIELAFKLKGVVRRLPRLFQQRQISFSAYQISAASLAMLCDMSDLVGECPSEFDQAPREPRIMLFDNQPGGGGGSKSLCSKIIKLLKICRDRISTCPCLEGCISCVCSAMCPELNAVIDKFGSLELLRKLLEVSDTSAK